jgi:hypothetical protein
VSDFIRARSATEIVDAAFQLYRRAPLEYMATAAMVYVPYLVLQLLTSSNLAEIEQSLGAGDTPSLDVMMPMMKTLFVSLVGVIVYTAMEAPLSWLTSEHYLGRSASAMDAIRATWRRMPIIVVSSTIRSIVIGVGYMLLIVPGVWLHAALFGVTQIMIIEKQRMGKSFDRSGALSNGNKLRILGTVLLATLLWFILTLGLMVALVWMQNPMISAIGSALLAIVAYPVLPIAKTVLYYDVRIRREGFDVEWMTAQGSPDRAGAPTGPAIA